MPAKTTPPIASEPAPTPPVATGKKTPPLRKILTLVALIFAGITLGLWAAYKQGEIAATTYQAPYLAVINAAPKGYVETTLPDISIRFNHPITAHHVAEFFEISPAVTGTFSQSGKDTAVFTPDKAFDSGTNVYVRIKSGLVSDTGKKLLDDFTFEFRTSQESRSITFSQGNWVGKFMSFDQRQGAQLEVNVGRDISKASVKIYKATPELMLQSLSFNLESPEDSQYRYGSYSQLPIDTSDLQEISHFDSVTDNQNIGLQSATGIYLVQGFDHDDLVGSMWVSLNETGIHFRQDDKFVYLAAQNLATQQPESDIQIQFYSLNKEPQVLATHTLSGIQQYPFAYPNQIDLVLAKHGAETLVIPVNMPNSQAEIAVRQDLAQAHELFIYSDRPIYKMNDKVSFRGVVRSDNDAVYGNPQVNQVRVFVPYYSAGKTEFIVNQIIDLQPGGIFSGEFSLPKEIRGVVRLYASTNLNVSPQSNYYSDNSTYFEVFEYTKPEYGLELSVNKSEYTRGDPVEITVAGTYFDGRPLANKTIDYSVFKRDFYETEKAAYNSSFNINSWGGMCGGGFSEWDEYYGEAIIKPQPLTLDANGKAVLTWSSKDLPSALSQEVTFVVESKDNAGNNLASAQNAIVHQGEFNLFFRPGPSQTTINQPLTTVVYAENADGTKLTNKTLDYQVYEQTYGAANGNGRQILSQGTVNTNDKGEATIAYTPKTSNYQTYLAVSGQDGLGNKIESNRYIYVYPETTVADRNYSPFKTSTSQTTLKIMSATNSLTVGKETTLSIESPADLQALVTFERGRVYKPQWLNLKKGENTFTFVVDETFAPSITPTFAFFWNGIHNFEGLALNVPAMHKLISVEISADKAQYAPNDTALITVVTKDATGNLISTDLGLGIVDKAIYALRKNATPPFHSSFYYFRARTTNSSSSQHWIALYDWGGRGGGGGGGDSGLFSKDADTLYWNPRLKTGTDGRITVPVTVGSQKTIWQITAFASTEDDTKLGQSELEFAVR